MATVPRLEKLNLTGMRPANDRINMQVQDQGSEILNQTNQVVQLGDKVGDIYQEYENDKIDQLASTAEMEYTAWNNDALAKLKNIEGDPTDAYVNYEQEAKKKYDDILAQRPDVSERVKRHLTGRMDKVRAGQEVAAMKQRGMQQEVYDNNVYESSLKLKRDSLPVRAGYVQKDDQGSYLMFDQSMNDIKTIVAKQGLKRGTVEKLPPDAQSWTHQYEDDDGQIVKVKMNDMAKARVAKELSEGVKTSLDVMIASGLTEEAKAMEARYAGYLDPKSSAAIKTKFSNADRKQEAYRVVGSLRGKSEEAQIAAIDNIQDPELRSEALKIKDADDAKIQSMRERKAKSNYNALAANVIEKMSSDEPYYGVADLENDPLYKQTWDNLDAKGKKAIVEMVQAPKTTSPKAEARIQNLFFGNDPDRDIGTMSPEDFQAELAGLSASDRKKYTNQYNRLRTQTQSEARATYKRAGQYLRDQFLADGHIERDKYGKFTNEDEVTLIKSQNALMNHLENYGGSMSEQQLRQFVKDFSAAEIKQQTFNPNPRPVFRAKNDTTTSPQDVNVSPQQLSNYKREFRRVNGYFPPNTDEKFEAFVKSRVKNQG